MMITGYMVMYAEKINRKIEVKPKTAKENRLNTNTYPWPPVSHQERVEERELSVLNQLTVGTKTE
jgi:hypothetical protein